MSTIAALLSSNNSNSPRRSPTGMPTSKRSSLTTSNHGSSIQPSSSADDTFASSRRSSSFSRLEAALAGLPATTSTTTVCSAKSTATAPVKVAAAAVGPETDPTTLHRERSHATLRSILKRPFRGKTSPSSVSSPHKDTDVVVPSVSSRGSLIGRELKLVGRNLSSDFFNMAGSSNSGNKKGSFSLRAVASPPRTPARKGDNDNALDGATPEGANSGRVPGAPRKSLKLASTEAFFAQHLLSHSRGSRRSSSVAAATASTTPGSTPALAAAAETTPTGGAAAYRSSLLAQRWDDSSSSSSESGSPHSATASRLANLSAQLKAGPGLFPITPEGAQHVDDSVHSMGRSVPTSVRRTPEVVKKPSSNRLSRIFPRPIRKWNSRLSISATTTAAAAAAAVDAQHAATPTPTCSTLPRGIGGGGRRPALLNLSADNPNAVAVVGGAGRWASELPRTEHLLQDAAALMVRFNAEFDDFSGATEAGVAAEGRAHGERRESVLPLVEGGKIHGFGDKTDSIARGRSTDTKQLLAGADVAEDFGIPSSLSGALPRVAAAAAASKPSHSTVAAVVQTIRSTPRQHESGPAVKGKRCGQQLDSWKATDIAPERTQSDSERARSNITSWAHAVAQANFMQRYSLELSLAGSESEASGSPFLGFDDELDRREIVGGAETTGA